MGAGGVRAAAADRRAGRGAASEVVFGVFEERGGDVSSNYLIDSVGLRILSLLQENARISFSEIGRQVGLTPTAVAERMRRLEDAQVIRAYRVDIAPGALGYTMTVFVRVTVKPGASQQLVRLAETMPEVLECYRITGDDSYLLKAVVTSVEHLEQVLIRIRALGQPATSVVLSQVFTHPVTKPRDGDPHANGNGNGNGAVRRADEFGARTA
jgi:Lrp/AsnC family leucine-responsive transcriptional regulator